MERFGYWHNPVTAMMEATEANDILMERAIAHKHCVSPVEDLSRVMTDLHGVERSYGGAGANTGPGPALVFVGDAFMTVVRTFV